MKDRGRIISTVKNRRFLLKPYLKYLWQKNLSSIIRLNIEFNWTNKFIIPQAIA